MEEISYATVREFHRFAAELPDVTKMNEDLKSFQRPWVVDRLLKHLPKGGRVLEIGADKCDLVEFLQNRGFEVWVIDVYDHFGGGTGTYDKVKERFPQLKIIRKFMHEDHELPANFFDAVYSCSVIEHIPSEHMAATCRRISDVLKTGGASIHAIDCTVEGIMINGPLVGEFIQGHQRKCDMKETSEKARKDLDTFYLSPQGHYRWRTFVGKTYDEYPYRRVTSVGFAATKGSEGF